MISALYVETDGVYFGLPGIDPWDEQRDARNYRGTNPVIAHPPCKRWGRYWSGGPSAKVRRLLGDDDGCFAAALWAVRTFGGVLEHPEASHAWSWFGIFRPPKRGQWWEACDGRGYTCCVEQGHYGHRARKATWLYVSGCDFADLPDLKWGKARNKLRLDDGCHSKSERATGLGAGRKRITSAENARTPEPFRDLLIDIAHSCDRRTFAEKVMAGW